MLTAYLAKKWTFATPGPVWLLEAEVRRVGYPVSQRHQQCTAGVAPFPVCLPDVGVRIRRGIIRQATSARCVGGLHVID